MAARGAAAGAAVAYLAWLRVTDAAKQQPEHWGPRWLARLLFLPLPRLFALLGVENGPAPRLDGISAEELQSLAPCVVTVSPHGTGVGHFFVTGPALASPPLASLHVLGIAASVVFRIPLFREFLLLMGWREASEDMVDRMLRAGRSCIVVPGGIAEMVEMDSTRDVLHCPPALGFVRLAMKHGVPILPLYCFGETQLFRTHTCLMPLRRRIAAHARVGIPFLSGRFGTVGLPLPLPSRYTVVVGTPVPTGAANPEPTQDEVREVFGRWCAELQRLFAAHATELLPAEVAAKGLTIHERRRRTPALRSKL